MLTMFALAAATVALRAALDKISQSAHTKYAAFTVLADYVNILLLLHSTYAYMADLATDIFYSLLPFLV